MNWLTFVAALVPSLVKPGWPAEGLGVWSPLKRAEKKAAALLAIENRAGGFPGKKSISSRSPGQSSTFALTSRPSDRNRRPPCGALLPKIYIS